MRSQAVISLCVVLLSVFAGAASAAELNNRLKDHASPYLAMHGEDPVAWQSWSDAVLEQAQKTNKLIFVSIGYFSCHWCHVMQRESYRDAAVAKLLNRDFIPVKVDRELDPALDAYLIDFVQKTRGYAGWPLNVFLTPEGHPVVGIVYLPKDQFTSLLTQLTELWRDNSESLKQTAAQAAVQQAQTDTMHAKLQPGIGKTLHSQLLQQVLQAANDIQGGFGDQAKFPMPAQLRFLLAEYQRQPSTQIAHFLQLTLGLMASQGLRDHIGGGFFRYTVDPDWHTPHFEKMLYDNAQLAALYLDAASVFKREDFEIIGTETLDFMLREMRGKSGGLVASLSAVDADNVEGGYYLWREKPLQTQLTTEEYAVVSLVWGLQNASHFEAGHLPLYAVSPDRAAQQLHKTVDEVMTALGGARAKLFAARQSRKLPVDDKQLAAWNGLALSALVRGARTAQGEHYRQAAHEVRDFLVKRLWDGRRLVRAKSAGNDIAAAGLEDYAYAAQGLLQWAQLTNSQQDRQLARLWIDIAWERFYTATGWRLSDQLSLPGVLGQMAFEDNPMPSPAAVVIDTSLQLAQSADDAKLRQRAINALAVSQEVLKTQPFAHATQIQLLANLPQPDS